MKSEDRMWATHLALIKALAEDPRLDSDYSRLRLHQLADYMETHGESDNLAIELELMPFYNEVLDRARGVTGYCATEKDKVTNKS